MRWRHQPVCKPPRLSSTLPQAHPGRAQFSGRHHHTLWNLPFLLARWRPRNSTSQTLASDAAGRTIPSAVVLVVPQSAHLQCGGAALSTEQAFSAFEISLPRGGLTGRFGSLAALADTLSRVGSSCCCSSRVSAGEKTCWRADRSPGGTMARRSCWSRPTGVPD